MKAAIKCSNCGVEIDALNFAAGPGRWLAILPTLVILVLVLLPMWRLYKPKGDYRADLVVVVQEKRMARHGMDILGTVENRGKQRAWYCILPSLASHPKASHPCVWHSNATTAYRIFRCLAWLQSRATPKRTKPPAS